MASVEETLAFVETVVAKTRGRWRGIVSDEELERHLLFVRELLMTHPVAIEYVARAMPRMATAQTEERRYGEVGDVGDKAVG